MDDAPVPRCLQVFPRFDAFLATVMWCMNAVFLISCMFSIEKNSLICRCMYVYGDV